MSNRTKSFIKIYLGIMMSLVLCIGLLSTFAVPVKVHAAGATGDSCQNSEGFDDNSLCQSADCEEGVCQAANVPVNGGGTTPPATTGGTDPGPGTNPGGTTPITGTNPGGTAPVTGTNPGGTDPGTGVNPGGTAGGTTLLNPLAAGSTSICGFVGKLIDIVTEIGAIVGVLFILWSGFLFIAAQGNPEKIKKAKYTFLTTIIGLGILLGASVFAQIITTTINNILPPSFPNICSSTTTT